MLDKVLSNYYERPPVVHPIEDGNIDEAGLSYYLLGYSAKDGDKYLAVLENNYEPTDFVGKNTESLKEHASVTVLGWHVLNAAKASVGKEVLDNGEAARNLDKLISDPEVVDIDSHSYALADVSLDFDLKVYG